MTNIGNLSENGENTEGYIVAIGASAGGLKAINDFFDSMPANTNLSFVIIQHLSPDHKSLMGELLSKHTPMQVFVAEEDMSIKPNCVYLIPSKKTLTLSNGHLKLKEKIKDQQPNSAIDIFFESLALEKKEKAVGIILSGTGTDGTKGIEAIKSNGGIILVQEPVTAEFDGMPNSAVATGYADLILSPDMMPEELLEFLKEAPLIKSFNLSNQQDDEVFYNIIELVHATTGHNFGSYKRPTLNRRLAKRMAELNIRTLPEYQTYLHDHPAEIRILSQEFLINVTRFFRDEEAFEIMKTKVIPSIFSTKKPGDIIKIWVVACSSGEEAYSLAMLLEEFIQEHKKFDVTVKIFATDIDQAAIDAASKGLYTEEAIKFVSPERLHRFFIREGNHYRILPSLRKLIVVARHDIAKDPPFSQIDLLCCRNMLIYMDALLQKKIFQKFHFAINSNGFIFLGPSESISSLKDVVEEIDRKWKVYKCISKERINQDLFLSPSDRANFVVPAANKSKNALNNLPEIFNETLLEDQSFAGIYIDKDFDVKQAIGNFKSFINFPDGSFNFNLLKLVPLDLSIALNSSIRKAIKEEHRVVNKRVKVQEGGKHRFIDIIVKPYLNHKNYLQPFIFVILNETKAEDIIPLKDHALPIEDASGRIEELEKELFDTKENLQALLEEVESANEELHSSNEEIVSANEELQSTNEELQSLNEELHTVNAEHQLKIKELLELNDDLDNVFNNTDIGQILIDKKLIIRKFTPVATQQVNLIETDIGRSITDISTNFRNLDFINEIKEVMATGKKIEKQLLMNDEGGYLMRMAPFIKHNGAIDGVVINFIDISEIKKLNTILEAVFESSVTGILAKKAVRNAGGDIVDFEYIAANRAAESLLGLQPNSLVGKTLLSLFPSKKQEYFEAYKTIVETGETRRFRVFNESNDRWLDVVSVKMMDGLLSSFTDITEQKKSEDLIQKGYAELQDTTNQLANINLELEKSNFDLMQFASVASHDLKEPLRKIQAYGNLFQDRVKHKLEEGENNYLEKVINSAKRMQIMIDDILTLSKLSNNEIKRESADLNKIVHNIIDDLEISIKEKQVNIQVERLPVISAVPGQMHQLFQNLIINGLKFNESQHPQIRIYQREITPEMFVQYGIGTGYICLSVKDNGIGIEPQYKEKIFGIFQRLNGSNFQGTGIGLAICKKIVENHNGIIAIETALGKGSEFLIMLPA